MSPNLKELDEETWKIAERFMENRDRRSAKVYIGLEKQRLMENGTISPISVPNILVKRDGKWIFPPITSVLV